MPVPRIDPAALQHVLLAGEPPPAAWVPHITALRLERLPLTDLRSLAGLTALETLVLARCPVALSHVDAPVKGKPAPKPTNWHDVLVVAHTPAGWKVDDVIYDAGFAFGNTGRLTDMLTMVVASNP